MSNITKMKKLVVYFSQTGNTKRVAEIIAKEEKADVEEIKEVKKRYTGFGWMITAGAAAARKKKSEIREVEYDPNDYDLIYIGTPVWAGKMVPALRTYLNENKMNEKKIALFSTSGGGKPGGTFESIKELVGDCKIVGELAVRDKEAKKGAEEKVKDWLAGIKA